MHRRQRKLAIVLACSVAVANPAAGIAFAATPDITLPTTPSAQQTPAQLEQLVAPIALYPDPLVSQVLVAATYPDQVREAADWVQDHPGLEAQALEKGMNRQPWDASVKALAEVPAVLENMAQNESWTTSLGSAYLNREQDVLNAIQALRQRARVAGNLESNAQETVVAQGSAISIQPTRPDVIYVPQYDPWIVYGPGLAAWPGWYWGPGLWWDGPGIGFGLGFRIGGGFHRGFGHGPFHGRDHFIGHGGFRDRGFHGGGVHHDFHGGGFRGGSFHGGRR